MKKIITVLSLCIACPISFADEFSLAKVEINRHGNYDGKIFYMTIKEGLRTDCAYSALYCTASFCKKTYASVVAAKRANKKVVNVDYLQDPRTKYCRISSVKFS